MEEYILIKKSELDNLIQLQEIRKDNLKETVTDIDAINDFYNCDRKIDTIKEVIKLGEVVQEVEIDAIRTKHFKDTNQHFNIDKKWTQNWIYNNIKILKTIEK